VSLADIMLDEHMKAFKAFLRRLAADGVCPVSCLPPTERAQNRARQKCRKAGWAAYSGRYWHLTESGRAIVERLTNAI
jgi:hypothetical protein